LHGEWRSTNALFGLSQFKDDVFGTYDRMGRIQVGSLTGRIIGSRLIFRWSNHTLEGVGCVEIGENRMEGGWWMNWEGPSFYELMQNPRLNLKTIKIMTPFRLNRERGMRRCASA
jgi:hypothetical protein